MFSFIYLFGVFRRFQHCTGHIATGSWEGRGIKYIQLVKVLYLKLPTNGRQLPAFPLEVRPGTIVLYSVCILSAISLYTTGFKALFNPSDCKGTAPTHR